METGQFSSLRIVRWPPLQRKRAAEAAAFVAQQLRAASAADMLPAVTWRNNQCAALCF